MVDTQMSSISSTQAPVLLDKYDPTEDQEILAWSDDEVDSDEDEVDETYNENRVEDEDWEIAERGSHEFFLLDC